MNIFEPKTFSTDWEIMVVDRLNRCLSDDKLAGFAGVLRAESGLPIQTDWNTLEFALGINSSFDEFRERAVRLTDRASQMLGEFDLDLFPMGAHPVEPMFNSSHIHVGTCHDEMAAVYLENKMMRYLPAFAAMAANSPFTSSRRGEFKSYRVKDMAYWCVSPIEVRDARMAQSIWDRDMVPKLSGSPTVEVRILDCTSSRRLLAEFAVFTAAYLHHYGADPREHRPTPEEYTEYLSNRWAAARYGLQATFNWDGKPKPVVDLLDEMLNECAADLETLGVKRSDLVILNRMIEKRICQADFATGLAERYPDKHCLASALGKLLRHWDVFEEYLESATPLDPVPALDEAEVIKEHLACVGEGTHSYRLRDTMYYPASVADEIIEQMIAQRLIRREITHNCGPLLYRTEPN